MLYYGEGFIHSDVYNMPIYLRNFYYKKLVDTRQKENEEIKKSNRKSRVSKPPMNPRFKR
tara:strand:- start:60 stop:239 length:180 start_codon:yes stop_codon:yes gene_type:complete